MPRKSRDIWARSPVFDDAICEFAVEYADQNQRDYRAFIKAVREGRLQVVADV